MDKRDSNGKPTVTKTPEDYLHFSKADLVILTLSIIENGVEKDVKTIRLWNEWFRPDLSEKLIV